MTVNSLCSELTCYKSDSEKVRPLVTLSTKGQFYTALEEDDRLTTSCVKISSNSLTPSTVVA